MKEETGLDVKQYANPHTFLQQRLNDQEVRLYIVPGVPKSTNLKPQTRNEIRVRNQFVYVLSLKHLLYSSCVRKSSGFH